MIDPSLLEQQLIAYDTAQETSGHANKDQTHWNIVARPLRKWGIPHEGNLLEPGRIGVRFDVES